MNKKEMLLLGYVILKEVKDCPAVGEELALDETASTTATMDMLARQYTEAVITECMGQARLVFDDCDTYPDQLFRQIHTYQRRADDWGLEPEEEEEEQE